MLQNLREIWDKNNCDRQTYRRTDTTKHNSSKFNFQWFRTGKNSQTNHDDCPCHESDHTTQLRTYLYKTCTYTVLHPLHSGHTIGSVQIIHTRWRGERKEFHSFIAQIRQNSKPWRHNEREMTSLTTSVSFSVWSEWTHKQCDDVITDKSSILCP